MTTQTNTKIDLSVELSKFDSTSKKIRYLSSLNMSRGQIERKLFELGVRTKEGNPIRYQFIRNVLLTPLTSK